MPLKVVVELQIHAVTCPGVFLPEKDEIFLNVSIMNQIKETGCLPAIFPLLFHEKMRFEKLFHKAADPAAITQLLEKDIARFEMVQLSHTAGDVLAIYEENSRDFLFPEPKLTPPYPGVDREVLMKTVHGFPGIAPKIEFSTRTTIKETTCKKKRHGCNRNTKRSLSTSPTKSRTSENQIGCIRSPERNYISPTRSSKSRSPSPYARRRMCELNKDSQQRLSHLNAGNSEFKSSFENKPPFIVRHVDSSKLLGWSSSSEQKSPKTKCYSRSPDRLNQPPLRRALSFDSFQDETAGKNFLALDTVKPSRKNISFEDWGKSTSTPFQLNKPSLRDDSNERELRSSLHERFHPDQSTWEVIHNRVRRLLSTHRAKQKLSYDISKSEVDDILDRSVFSKSPPNHCFLEKRF
uniref:Spermatosis associated 6 like n=1 Tax=Leptobrachium leishanense TaxID=445787 RepID=A0A8C5LSL1_9ANUR